MSQLTTTAVTGWGETATICYHQHDGHTTVTLDGGGGYRICLGRFTNYHNAVAKALASVDPNPRWSQARKAMAERGAQLTPIPCRNEHGDKHMEGAHA